MYRDPKTGAMTNVTEDEDGNFRAVTSLDGEVICTEIIDPSGKIIKIEEPQKKSESKTNRLKSTIKKAGKQPNFFGRYDALQAGPRGMSNRGTMTPTGGFDSRDLMSDPGGSASTDNHSSGMCTD